MPEASADALLLKIIRRAEDVNALAIAILEASPGIFDKVSQKTPKVNPPELGYIRSASWLYVLYYEAGKVNRIYVESLLAPYGLDSTIASSHAELVQAMRTLLQHNLDISEPHDKNILSRCHAWYKEKCGTAVPETDEDWHRCLLAMLTEALEYLDVLEKCLRSIEKDESRDTIRSRWIFQRKRHHEPEQFDRLIPVVASDIGRDYLDVMVFRKRYYDRWISQLRTLSADYEFEIEARKLIEDSLLKDVTSVIPITGADILGEFKLGPGREIGIILAEAKRVYEASPCSREILLKRLQPFVEEIIASKAEH